MTESLQVTSRSNATLVAIRRLVRDGAAYRRQGSVWLEGDHLCAAAVARGVPVRQAIVSESGWRRPERRDLAAKAGRAMQVPDNLFAELGGLESPADIGFLIDLPLAPVARPALSTVVLDRLQDAGNVGSILRTAAALGVQQVLALKGSAALWSPKVLRAGMGAHFGLSLLEGLTEDDLLALGLDLVGTTSHGGQALPHAALPAAPAWLFGHEGQGASQRLMDACCVTVGIPQPGGEESLNVAAAAAICLYEGLRRRSPLAGVGAQGQ